MQAIQRDGEKRRTAIIQSIDEEIGLERIDLPPERIAPDRHVDRREPGGVRSRVNYF